MRARLVLAAAAVVSACGAAPQSAESSTKAAQGGGRPFTITPVAEFGAPWAMAFLPGSGLPLTNMALVTERTGKLWLVDTATGRKQEVSGIPEVAVAGQGGLGDVVPHPGFAGNQRVYLSFAEAGANGTSGAAIGYGRLVFVGPAVAGGPASPQLSDFKVIWRQAPKVSGNGHFGHRIAFASDETMFVTSGDRQKMQPAQDPNSDLGKILRLTDEGAPAAGNPWVGAGGRRATHWSMGHRNPLGLAFAPDGRLWSTEMGPEGGDELNLIAPGKNYGWPDVSYGSHYGGGPIPDDHAARGFEEPKLWWNPVIAPGGLHIYRGRLFPGWRGDALIPGLVQQGLVRVDLDGETARKAEEWPLGTRIRAVTEGPRGELYVLEDGRDGSGRLLRLEPAR